MDHEERLSKALADGAEMLVKAIEQCHASARLCIDAAWTAKDVISAGRSTNMAQTYDFIRLAGEVGTALSKLKGQGHHQHISVERIDPARPPANAIVLEQSPVHVVQTAETFDDFALDAKTLATSEAPLDPGLDPGGRGEGEGYDKQLDVAAAEDDPAS